MLKNNKDDFVKAINSLTGDTIFVLKSQLKDIEHKIDSNGNIHVIPSKKHKSNEQIPNPNNGCILAFCVLFTVCMGIGCIFMMKKEYKENKQHKNVISYIDNSDKTIVISDVKTNEQRMINYDGYKDVFAKQNKLPEFEEQVKHSNIGDTVVFVSPKYDDKKIFVLDIKNRLSLNKDSVVSRINKTKQR